MQKIKIEVQPARKSILNALEIANAIAPTNNVIPIESSVRMYADAPGYVYLDYCARVGSAKIRTALVTKEPFSIIVSARDFRNILKSFSDDEIGFTIEFDPDPKSLAGSLTYKCGRSKGKILRTAQEEDMMVMFDFSTTRGNIEMQRDELAGIVSEGSAFCEKDSVQTRYQYISAYAYGTNIEFYATNGTTMYRNAIHTSVCVNELEVFFINTSLASLIMNLSSAIKLGWTEKSGVVVQSDDASIYLPGHGEAPIKLELLKSLNRGGLASEPIATNISAKDLSNAIKRALVTIPAKKEGATLILSKSKNDQNCIMISTEDESGTFYSEEIQAGQEVKDIVFGLNSKAGDILSKVIGFASIKKNMEGPSFPLVLEFDEERYALLMPIIFTNQQG